MQNTLSDRAVLALTGGDRVSFLQGLVSADVTTVSATTAVWSALLTPQGRWLSEFFLFAQETETGQRLLMDCPSSHAEILIKRLSRFRLRSDVQIEKTSLQVATGPEGDAPAGAVVHAPDPRFEGAGWRAIVDDMAYPGENNADYLTRRLSLGLPDTADFVSEQTLALEGDLDLLNAVSWTKGCYMGQEITARTHYRGLVKRRLVPVELEVGSFPEDGGIILRDGQDVGDLRSRQGNRALAMLRREAWSAPDLTCEGHRVKINWPAWFPLEKRS